MEEQQQNRPSSREQRANSREQRQQQINEQANQSQLAKQRAKAAIKSKAKKDSFFTTYQYHIVIGVFLGVCLLAISSTLFKDNRKLNQIQVLDEDEIQNFNSQGYPFQLGTNEFFRDWSLQDAKAIVNNQISTKTSLPRCTTHDDTSIIPDRYNFREAHPECSKPIINQGNCSSSYAIAPITAISDRICLKTKGKLNPILSAQVVLSCDNKNNNQCKGGTVSNVLDFAKKSGIVEEECFGYQGHSDVACPSSIETCQRHKIVDYCVSGKENGVKREILQNGPVVAVIPIYKDFLQYKSGVYSVLEGTSKFQGGHALKIIGWDRDQDFDLNYWIVENTWGETWGVNGLGHIQIGQKQLYLEQFVIAPNPMAQTQQEQVKQKVQQKQPEVQTETKEKTEEVNLDEKN